MKYPDPPLDASLPELLRAAMELGMGREFSKEQFISRDAGYPWLGKQLASELFIASGTLSSWRTGRRLPSWYSLNRLIQVLTGDAPELEKWREAFRNAFVRAGEPQNSHLSQNVEIPAVPEQSERALVFSFDGHRFDFRDISVDDASVDDRYRAIYDELLTEVRAAIALIPEGSNLLSSLKDFLLEYRDALGKSPVEIAIIDTWRLGRRLRRLNRLDRRRRHLADPDESPLPADIGERLEEIVVLHNTLSSLDPLMSEYDRRGSDPAERHVSAAIGDAKQVAIATALEPETFERKVPEILHELLATDAPSVQERLRDMVLGVDSTRNLVVILVAEAVREKREETTTRSDNEFRKSFLSTAGQLTATGLAAGGAAVATAFVMKYGGDLLALAERLPGGDVIQTVIRWIMGSTG